MTWIEKVRGSWHHLSQYCSTLWHIFLLMLKSEKATALLVVIIISLLSEQIKLAETSNFISFRSLLMFDIWTLACNTIASKLFALIEMIICFLEGLLVVMLIFSLSFIPLLLVILWILIIFLMLLLEAWAYEWLFEFVYNWLFVSNG